MSEESYQHNVRRGVTGRRTNTCYAASFDRVSNRFGVSPQTYELYEELIRAYDSAIEVDQRNYVPPEIEKFRKNVVSRVHRELGVEVNRNIVELTAKEYCAFQSALAQLALGGFRTMIRLDVGGLHDAGVIPYDSEHYIVKSTWSPFEEDAPIHTGDLFKHLEIPPRIHKKIRGRDTTKEPNIVALPPEPRR